MSGQIHVMNRDPSAWMGSTIGNKGRKQRQAVRRKHEHQKFKRGFRNGKKVAVFRVRELILSRRLRKGSRRWMTGCAKYWMRMRTSFAQSSLKGFLWNVAPTMGSSMTLTRKFRTGVCITFVPENVKAQKNNWSICWIEKPSDEERTPFGTPIVLWRLLGSPFVR